MTKTILKDTIIGARNFRSFFIMLILFLGGIGFFLAGLSSYLHTNLLVLTNSSQIT